MIDKDIYEIISDLNDRIGDLNKRIWKHDCILFVHGVLLIVLLIFLKFNKWGYVMKIEKAIKTAVMAVVYDMRLPQETKREVVDALKECEDLANIGTKTKDMFENNKVDIFLNATWDDGYIASYSEELSTLDELMEFGEDD